VWNGENDALMPCKNMKILGEGRPRGIRKSGGETSRTGLSD